MTPEEILGLSRWLTADELLELQRLVALDMQHTLWRPLPGPQSMAYASDADVIGFGGAAGGGKTDLAIGKALMDHHRVMILRREGTQMQAIIDRVQELLGGDRGYNGQRNIWRGAGPRNVQLEFGSTPNPGDETKYQGRPHDLLVFDEAANFLEAQVRFLLGWNRSVRRDVRSQALLTFNPPTEPEGRWIVAFFGPWLDRRNKDYPAAPGEKRLVAVIPRQGGTSEDLWLEDPRPFVLRKDQRIYDFDPLDFRPEEIITPSTRTFIPSKISDNPYLMGTGYLTVLQSMPEPLRSQMLYGDFEAGLQDSPWQVIPSAWIDAAMARWVGHSPRGEQLSVGVDIARGGKDQTVIATRWEHGQNKHWFAPLVTHAGKDTPDGHSTAGLIIAEHRHQAPLHIDVIGVGASPYDVLNDAGLPAIGVNMSASATSYDRSGRLEFSNMRSQIWWQLREALDPANDTGIALPPDNELRVELATPTWKLKGKTIYVLSREEIVEKIGRSPDRATAVALALIDTPKIAKLSATDERATVLDYNPYAARSA